MASLLALWALFQALSHCCYAIFSRRKARLHRLAPLTGPQDRMTLANLTCEFIEQPLNHHWLPRDGSPTYRQRYCYYAGFVDDDNYPILFYVGNESPLDEYVNHTGLMWELAPQLSAMVVFAEHRYEGESLPDESLAHCLAYSSSVQALADYAALMERHPMFVNAHGRRRPVIAFGGSYGGMLAAWIRFQYPHLVAGAIAGSAPIFGLPRTNPEAIDAAWRVIEHGTRQSYPPTEPVDNENHCADNLLAAWPLIEVLGRTDQGRALLTGAFKLCEPLSDATRLREWAQSPWFDLAESSFPYPSGYIVYALTHDDSAQLPAWPLQDACWKGSRLHEDFGVRLVGDTHNVSYTVHYGDSGWAIDVDWDEARSDGDFDERFANSSVEDLLTAVRDAVSIWFNLTGKVTCYDLEAAPNLVSEQPVQQQERWLIDSHGPADASNHSAECYDRIHHSGSWPSLCCNEDMNMIITEARGLGYDVFWPPSHPRGTTTHEDVVAVDGNMTDRFCDDPEGAFGFPKAPDLWSTWLDTVYGGTRIGSYSNVVFSNGLLDPWSAAGVYHHAAAKTIVPGLTVEHVGHSMLALLLDYGGHHTDLMYSDPADPPSITEARRMERNMIETWIEEWNR